MPATILGSCPGCKKTLRLPEQATGQTVRCKLCGMVSQVKPTAKLLARQAAAAVARPTVAMVLPAPKPAPPAPTPAAAHAAAPASGDAWSAITDEALNDPAIAPARRYRKRGSGWLMVLFSLVFLLICLGGTIAAIVYVAPRWREATGQPAAAQASEPNRPAITGNPDLPAAGAGLPFPRRLLGISVNNYIFANPTSYGYDSRNLIKRDFGKTLEKIANKLRIPDNQVFELSDGAPGKRQHPPLKPIIEQTLTRFVETSRPQDRVIVVLCAHTVEIDGKPYVAPLEGDLEDARTLIPLEWIMQQLDRCPAQQKLLIADFNRYDKGRGKERPHGGKLAASTEALLKNPPKGVQVWSACSAGEYSYEFDDYYGFDGQGIKGGAFLCMFSVAFLEGIGGKIQKPDDPLPIDLLAAKINPYTMKLSTELEDPDADAAATDARKDDKKDEKKDEKKEKKAAPHNALQTPFLAGAMKGEPREYNPREEAPAPVVLPAPEDVYGKGVLPREEVRKMLDVFALPPIKEARGTASAVRFDQVLPFRAEAMADYKVGTSVADIKANPERYPLRAAVVDALEKIRALDAGDIALPTSLRESDRTDASKANLARLQRGPARVMQLLETLNESLQKVAEERKEEKSKFWQATLDYAMAQVKFRFVYVHEYTSVIGQVRKDALPELDAKKLQVGWRLASRDSLATTDNSVKDMSKEARKIFAKLAKDNPGTPWEVLARREKSTALGLRWEPFAEAKTEQAEATADRK